MIANAFANTLNTSAQIHQKLRSLLLDKMNFHRALQNMEDDFSIMKLFEKMPMEDLSQVGAALATYTLFESISYTAMIMQPSIDKRDRMSDSQIRDLFERRNPAYPLVKTWSALYRSPAGTLGPRLKEYQDFIDFYFNGIIQFNTRTAVPTIKYVQHLLSIMQFVGVMGAEEKDEAWRHVMTKQDARLGIQPKGEIAKT